MTTLQNSTWKYIFTSTILLLSLVSPLAAQDILQTEYGELHQLPVSVDGDQYFIQFTGAEGDVIYVQADFEDIAIGADIELDLRDSVGRSIGFKEDYSFDPFILATLPSDGTYTAVFTYRNSSNEENHINAVVGKTFALSPEAASVTISTEGFPAIMALSVDQSGDYIVQFERTDGQMATNFTIQDYSGLFTQSVLTVSGTSTMQWAATISLNADARYVVFLSPNLFRERNTDATVSIRLERSEDE